MHVVPEFVGAIFDPLRKVSLTLLGVINPPQTDLRGGVLKKDVRKLASDNFIEEVVQINFGMTFPRDLPKLLVELDRLFVSLVEITPSGAVVDGDGTVIVQRIKSHSIAIVRPPNSADLGPEEDLECRFLRLLVGGVWLHRDQGGDSDGYMPVGCFFHSRVRQQPAFRERHLP